ncbi:MAG: hypothetical protein J7K54_04295 [Candidatus Aenigmarchaeota archaeon]|nr:hypothetical protein [Candidatus Aenigmarchaeota archaeon]
MAYSYRVTMRAYCHPSGKPCASGHVTMPPQRKTYDTKPRISDIVEMLKDYSERAEKRGLDILSDSVEIRIETLRRRKLADGG